MRESVTVNGVVLTKDQIMEAVRELNKPVEPVVVVREFQFGHEAAQGGLGRWYLPLDAKVVQEKLNTRAKMFKPESVCGLVIEPDGGFYFSGHMIDAQVKTVGGRTRTAGGNPVMTVRLRVEEVK